MKTKHTEGNWAVKIGPHDEQCSLFSDVAGRTVLATKSEHWPASFEETVANFKLMAAAPAMLDTLKKVVEGYEGGEYTTDQVVRFAKEVIKKATA